MKNLNKLLVDLNDKKIYGDENIFVNGVKDDSRSVKKGDVFVAIKGLTVDAHEFIPNVIEKGVRVVVGEVEPEKTWLKKVTYIKVPNSRRALGLLASSWYGNPSKKS